MDEFLSFGAKLLNVGLACVAIGLLIGVHELGHFIAAKLIGVRVDAFSLGFWKKLISWKRGDTEYKICVIPLGGYVKLAGEERPAPKDGETPKPPAPDEFFAKKPLPRIFVFVAGAAMNAVFAVLAFILAFAVGVKFIEPRIGETLVGTPAWQAGLRRGDLIVAVNGRRDPDFEDVMAHTALPTRDNLVHLKVSRDGKELSYDLTPEYNEDSGLYRLGLLPVYTAHVTGLAKVKSPDGFVRPAEAAGLKAGDAIVGINGQPVASQYDLVRLTQLNGPKELEVQYERRKELGTVRVTPVPEPSYVIGVSCVSTRVTEIAPESLALKAGLRVGDTITHVGGAAVKSVIEIRDAMRGRPDNRYALRVLRDGQTVELRPAFRDSFEALEFQETFVCDSSEALLTWVKEKSPAWEAGMRPGDRILAVDGKEVSDWKDFLRASGRAGEGPRELKWRRGDEEFAQTVTPAWEFDSGVFMLGVEMGEPQLRARRYGIVRSVHEGLYKSLASLRDLARTIRGFFTRQIHTKNMGGIILIGQVSYRAAREGLGRLFYTFAIIGMGLAFPNLMPVPVLDGGHVAFTLVEAVRGKPVPHRIMAISQYVGIALLLFLVAYVTKNDILRLIFM